MLKLAFKFVHVHLQQVCIHHTWQDIHSAKGGILYANKHQVYKHIYACLQASLYKTPMAACFILLFYLPAAHQCCSTVLRGMQRAVHDDLICCHMLPPCLVLQTDQADNPVSAQHTLTALSPTSNRLTIRSPCVSSVVAPKMSGTLVCCARSVSCGSRPSYSAQPISP